MTETVGTRHDGGDTPQPRRGGGPAGRARLHDRRRAPLRRGHLGAPRRRHDQLARRLDQLRAARRRVPRLLVDQRDQHRHHEVLPRRGRQRPARVRACASSSTGSCSPTARPASEHGYFATEGDAEIFEHELTWMLLHQVFSFNSPVWFNVGTTRAAAGQRLLHPRRRRHDGLDPELVPGGGPDLQGRLRRRPQPLPHPLLQGAAVLRRHRLRPGQLHARRRRLAPAPSSPVAPPAARPRWSSSTSTTPTSRSSSRPRRARRTRSASLRDAGFDMDLGGKDITSVQYQNANNSVRVSDEFMRAVEDGERRSGCGPASTARGHRDRRRARRCSARSPRPRGSAPTRASSTTTRSTTGTPTRRPAGSPRPTRARST